MYSCSQCGETFTRKNNLTRHKTMNRCKKSAVKRSNPFSSVSNETYHSPSEQHYSNSQQQSPIRTFNVPTNTSDTATNPKLQELIDMAINDGIPENKSLNESVSKKKKLSSTIAQSFNEPMARMSSYTAPPLKETRRDT